MRNRRNCKDIFRTAAAEICTIAPEMKWLVERAETVGSVTDEKVADLVTGMRNGRTDVVAVLQDGMLPGTLQLALWYHKKFGSDFEDAFQEISEIVWKVFKREVADRTKDISDLVKLYSQIAELNMVFKHKSRLPRALYDELRILYKQNEIEQQNAEAFYSQESFEELLMSGNAAFAVEYSDAVEEAVYRAHLRNNLNQALNSLKFRMRQVMQMRCGYPMGKAIWRNFTPVPGLTKKIEIAAENSAATSLQINVSYSGFQGAFCVWKRLSKSFFNGFGSPLI